MPNKFIFSLLYGIILSVISLICMYAYNIFSGVSTVNEEIISMREADSSNISKESTFSYYLLFNVDIIDNGCSEYIKEVLKDKNIDSHNVYEIGFTYEKDGKQIRKITTCNQFKEYIQQLPNWPVVIHYD